MASVPTRWDRERNVKWRTPLAQPANGSPIVVGEKVLLTMAADAEGKRRSLHCFNRATGSEVWVRTVDFGKVLPTHVENPYCGTTPASDGECVVVWHASAGLWCYGLDGEERWHRDLGEFRHRWGYGTSPVIHGDRVILHTGPGARTFVAAYGLASGEELWRVEEPSHLPPDEAAQGRMWGSWSTPVVRRVGERDLVLCALPTRVVAYDAQSGDVVWWCRGISTERSNLTSASPIVVGDTCVILGAGVALAVAMDGAGDVTESHRRWRRELDLQNCSSGILAAGSLYVPDNLGMLWCLDPTNGETRWKKRIARGGVWGSVAMVADKLFLVSLKGTTVVFEPGDEAPAVLGENSLDETTAASPAFSSGEIFVRTYEHLYCIAEAMAGEDDRRTGRTAQSPNSFD